MNILLAKVVVQITLLSLIVTAQGDHAGYQLIPENSEPRYCDTDASCHRHKGEVCWWFYDGCDKGQCMCHPRTHRWGNSNKCEPVMLGGDRCSLDLDCPATMACHKGVCVCEHDNSYLAPDGTICLLQHHKLLGQECTPFDDTCVQRASYGYTDHEVACDRKGECVCTDGYKRDGDSCRKWDIGEKGCSDSYHCQGGAVCVDSKCVCPTGYHSAAYNSKCAKDGATTGLRIGAYCDEVKKRRYCGSGLVCHQCGGHQDHKCVRFVMVTLRPPTSSKVTGGAGSLHTTQTYLPGVLITCLVTLVTQILRCVQALDR